MGRVVGAITGKKEGENIVDITTTIDLLQVFWEAERVRGESRAFPTYDAAVASPVVQMTARRMEIMK